jgi:hypothetical protein
MPKNSIVYIATDRAYAGRFRLYGGYNLYPNMERMAAGGTLYRNATATAGSTLMCHASEWTGRYSWELHKGHKWPDRVYQRQIPAQDSIFTDLEKDGYDLYVVLVNKRPGKCYDSFKPVFKMWPKSTKIALTDDWDLPGARNSTRRTQFDKIIECVENSEKNGRKAFVWMKCHGYYQIEQREKYVDYAGQKRTTKEDIYNAEIDDNLGHLMDKLGTSDTSPDIYFASDHGSFMGEMLRSWYGYHLHQEIVHVPFICSKGGGKEISNPFSMKEVRRILNGTGGNFSEEYIFAETLFPGQKTHAPNNGVSSLAKIMVRLNRYKYIYSPYGQDGMSAKPTEELYDLAYDPREKFNMADVFSKKYVDLARPGLHGQPLPKVLSRIHSNNQYALGKQTIDTKRYPQGIFMTEFNERGWFEVYDILQRLRRQAKIVWNKTGRKDLFKV